jgi:hypothetical protein
MKANQKRKRKTMPVQVPTLEERVIQARVQCELLISFLYRQAGDGRPNLALNLLENTAAHLELLADQPQFHESLEQSALLPIYNESVVRRREARLAAVSENKVSWPEAGQAQGSKMPTPTAEQLQALFDLPSEPSPQTR